MRDFMCVCILSLALQMGALSLGWLSLVPWAKLLQPHLYFVNHSRSQFLEILWMQFSLRTGWIFSVAVRVDFFGKLFRKE